MGTIVKQGFPESCSCILRPQGKPHIMPLRLQKAGSILSSSSSLKLRPHPSQKQGLPPFSLRISFSAAERRWGLSVYIRYSSRDSAPPLPHCEQTNVTMPIGLQRPHVGKQILHTYLPLKTIQSTEDENNRSLYAPRRSTTLPTHLAQDKTPCRHPTSQRFLGA